MSELRPYQAEAVQAVYDHLTRELSNPCVVLPTGTGKSYVIAKIATDVAAKWSGRVLVLAHVKELIEQNAAKLRLLCGDVPVGIYSAGLKSRDTEEPVIVAGIQSVYQRATDLGRFDLVIVDEAHLIPPTGDGMYRTLLAELLVINPHIRVVGLTATPYRLRGGALCGPDNVLNAVCYEAGLKEMILDGYLCPLKTKSGHTGADLSNLHIKAGEFVSSEVEAAVDTENVVSSACFEIVKHTEDRQAVLVFGASVAHAWHVADELRRRNRGDVAVITGETPSEERDEIIARFRGQRVQNDLFEAKPPLKYLVNVNVLTTGFDATNVDCVVLLRPTASPGLYVQMIGRGTRTHPGKDYCLVLDFGGNVLRHGPVDAVAAPAVTGGSGNLDAAKVDGDMAKECPECSSLIGLGFRICPECGHQFTEATHASEADDAPILTGQILDETFPVESVYYAVHKKRNWEPGDPLTMRVEYAVGFGKQYCEWVCFEHEGFARRKAVTWWQARSRAPVPETVEDAVNLALDGALAEPSAITVRTIAGERFPRIVGYDLEEIPEWREPGLDFEEINVTSDGLADEEVPF